MQVCRYLTPLVLGRANRRLESKLVGEREQIQPAAHRSQPVPHEGGTGFGQP